MLAFVAPILRYSCQREVLSCLGVRHLTVRLRTDMFAPSAAARLPLTGWCLCSAGREYHFLKPLGPEVALLGIDMRTKRRKSTILPQARTGWQLVLAHLPPLSQRCLFSAAH
jgi:hypothetical protein